MKSKPRWLACAMTIAGTMPVGCGGESSTGTVTNQDGTGTSDAEAQDAAGTSHDASAPPDAVADTIAPAKEAMLPVCCSEPGNYFIEVIGAMQGGEIYQWGSLGSGNTPAGITCTPTVPWSYQDASGNWGIYACASSDTTRRCINLDNGDPGGGRYVDSQGIVSTLRHPALLPSGSLPSGEYTATMIDPAGVELTVHGRFTVCPAFFQPL